MSSRYDAVIFDLHGTLVPWSKDGFQTMLLQMAGAVGAAGDDFVQVMNESVHESMTGHYDSLTALIEQHCRTLGIHGDAHSVEEAALLWSDFHWQGYERAYPGVLTVLQGLREMGMHIGLITNCGAEAPELWSRSQFAALADATVFSVTEGLVKPDPRMYLIAIERLAVAPERCLYVDDSVACLLGAEAVGMGTLLIRHPGNTLGLADVDDWNGPRITELGGVLGHISA